jgi:hypothetical protein
VFVPGINGAIRRGLMILLQCDDVVDSVSINQAIRLAERGGLTLFGGERFEYYRFVDLKALNRTVA